MTALMDALHYLNVLIEDGGEDSAMLTELCERATDELMVLLDPPPLPRPKVCYTALPDGVLVGWDTCDKCQQVLTGCSCVSPTRPMRITKMLERELAETATSAPTSKERVATVVPEDQIPENPLSQKSGSDSTGIPVVQSGTLTCKNCTLPKSLDQGDTNDDGTFTCHVCQSEGT